GGVSHAVCPGRHPWPCWRAGVSGHQQNPAPCQDSSGIGMGVVPPLPVGLEPVLNRITALALPNNDQACGSNDGTQHGKGLMGPTPSTCPRNGTAMTEPPPMP